MEKLAVRTHVPATLTTRGHTRSHATLQDVARSPYIVNSIHIGESGTRALGDLK